MWGSNNLLFTPVDNDIEQPKNLSNENQEFVNSEGDLGIMSSALGTESATLGNMEGDSSVFDNNSDGIDADDDY
jgi:hypothetical protein